MSGRFREQRSISYRGMQEGKQNAGRSAPAEENVRRKRKKEKTHKEKTEMRNDVNNISLTGRLVRDAEKKAENFATATIAVNRYYKGKDGNPVERVGFIDLELNGRDKLVPYLTKGQAIAVTGYLNQRKWEDKDGGKHSAIAVHVNTIEFIAPPKKDASGTTAPAPADPMNAADEPLDDNIPF